MNETTPEEFALAMTALANLGDQEIAHSAAEELMLNLLEQLGYGAGVKTFRSIGKWYV